MSSQFGSLFNRTSAEMLHRHFGESVEYTGPAGSVVAGMTLENVIVSEERQERRFDDSGISIVRLRSFECVIDSTHSRYCGVDSILMTGLMAHASVDYAIERIESIREGVVLVHGIRMTTQRRHREGLRSNPQ
jgi:hypothetical protein